VEPCATDPSDSYRLDRRQRGGRDRSFQGWLVRPRRFSRVAVLDQHPVLLPGNRAAVRLRRPARGTTGGWRVLVRNESGVVVDLLRRRHHLLLVTVLVAGVGVYRRAGSRHALDA